MCRIIYQRSSHHQNYVLRFESRDAQHKFDDGELHWMQAASPLPPSMAQFHWGNCLKSDLFLAP